MNSRTINFEVDKMKLLEEISDNHLAYLELYVCHDGKNSHDLIITRDTIERSIPTLVNKCCVADYSFGSKDFTTHTPDEMIIGFFPKENNMRMTEPDFEGKSYLVANVILSKIYAKWAYDIFVNKGNERPVSMEIEIIETELIDGKEKIIDFVFRGVTILGANVRPSCEGSNAKITKFSNLITDKEMRKDYKKALDEYKYSKIDFSIPADVKNIIENELKINKNISTVDLSFSKYLIKNEKISMTKLNQLTNHFSKFEIQPNFLGNQICFDWANSLQNQINNIDIVEFESDENSKEKEADIVPEEFVKDEEVKEEDFGCGEAKMADDAEVKEEEKETPAEQAKEEETKEEDFGSDANVENGANAEINDKNAETDEKLAEENSNMEEAKMAEEVDFATMYTEAMAKVKALEEENFALKAFKAEIDENTKKMAVEQAMFSICEGYEISEEQKNELIAKSVDFSVEEIGNWETYVKVQCFDFPRKVTSATNFARIDIPATHTNKVPEKAKSVWERL